MNDHTDNSSENQDYSGILPNICIKCKRAEVKLTTYNYRMFKKKGSMFFKKWEQTEMNTIVVPVCTSCRPEIERHPRIIQKLLSELISDEEYQQEVRAKMSNVIDDLEAKKQITFYCTKCGAERTALDDFCNSCGKDLRQFKKKLESHKREQF